MTHLDKIRRLRGVSRSLPPCYSGQAVLAGVGNEAALQRKRKTSWTHSFFGRFRTVQPAGYANAIVVLYLGAALLGAIVYLYFKVDIQPNLERDRHWHALGLFDLKEDFAAIGIGLLPAYWISWRWPHADERGRTAAALTTILGFIVWWSFLVGHVVNNIMGFGS